VETQLVRIRQELRLFSDVLQLHMWYRMVGRLRIIESEMTWKKTVVAYFKVEPQKEELRKTVRILSKDSLPPKYEAGVVTPLLHGKQRQSAGSKRKWHPPASVPVCLWQVLPALSLKTLGHQWNGASCLRFLIELFVSLFCFFPSSLLSFSPLFITFLCRSAHYPIRFSAWRQRILTEVSRIILRPFTRVAG
jgi:hypothetical protein